MPLSKQQTMLTAQVNQHSKLRRKLIRECEFNVHRWFPRLRCLMSYTSRHTEFGERNHTLQEHGLVTLLFTRCIWPLRLCKKLTPATAHWPDTRAATARQPPRTVCQQKAAWAQKARVCVRRLRRQYDSLLPSAAKHSSTRSGNCWQRPSAS